MENVLWKLKIISNPSTPVIPIKYCHLTLFIVSSMICCLSSTVNSFMSATCRSNFCSQLLSFLVFPATSVTAPSSQFLQMLHELVVALRGHPGHVFQEREGKFLVNPALSLFHPCEVALLNQVSLNSFNLQGENPLFRCWSWRQIIGQWLLLSRDTAPVERRACTWKRSLNLRF